MAGTLRGCGSAKTSHKQHVPKKLKEDLELKEHDVPKVSKESAGKSHQRVGRWCIYELAVSAKTTSSKLKVVPIWAPVFTLSGLAVSFFLACNYNQETPNMDVNSRQGLFEAWCLGSKLTESIDQGKFKEVNG